MKSFVLDTGPLVALLDKRDAHHAWAVAAMKTVTAPLLTCDAVLTESLYLLGSHPGPRRQLREWLSAGRIRVAYVSSNDGPLILQLMDRYASVPMSFADACVVQMSEILPGSTVFTTDSDFRIYRRHKRQVIPILAPPP